MIKLSKTRKLDGIRSWSLQALDTCPGSVDHNGTLVPACSGCYATTGCYVFKTTIAPRVFNKEDWKRADWVSDMVEALKESSFFRWFDSGDMYCLELAHKIYRVMESTPWVSHWLPTRMAKFEKFRDVIASMEALPNVKVRFSSDSITGEYVPYVHGSTIIQTAQDATPEMFVCRAYENGGKCSGCRACYFKQFPLIAYVAHGRKIKKVYKIHAA